MSSAIDPTAAANSIARELATLGRGGEDAGADLLGQHENIAGLGAGIADDFFGMDSAGDEEAEFRLLVDDGMAAGNGDARLRAHGNRAVEHARERAGAERVDRPGHEAQGVERPRAHRIDVAQGVGGGDAAVIVGIIDDGRKHIDGLDQRDLVREPHHRGIVAGVMPDQHARILGAGQMRQRRAQIRLADLCRASGRACQRGQGNQGQRHGSTRREAAESGAGKPRAPVISGPRERWREAPIAVKLGIRPGEECHAMKVAIEYCVQ